MIEMVIKLTEKDYEDLIQAGENTINLGLLLNLKMSVKRGVVLPKGHGAIKDVSQIEIPMCEDRTYERWVQVAINSAPTIIEADTNS